MPCSGCKHATVAVVRGRILCAKTKQIILVFRQLSPLFSPWSVPCRMWAITWCMCKRQHTRPVRMEASSLQFINSLHKKGSFTSKVNVSRGRRKGKRNPSLPLFQAKQEIRTCSFNSWCSFHWWELLQCNFPTTTSVSLSVSLSLTHHQQGFKPFYLAMLRSLTSMHLSGRRSFSFVR